MEISITVEGFGLTWPRWIEFITTIENSGFAGIFKSDHFTLPNDSYPASLETMVAITYVASHIPRVHFGTLIAPVSFRDPVMLARQAMALDDLSGGRMILGVSAGWMEREHRMFGYKLGTPKQRADRLEEGLEVITRLIRSDQPVTFEGRYFQLQEAMLMPRSRRKTPILIGGEGPKRILPLVARYADIWNCHWSSVEVFKERSALLDDLLTAEGRQPDDVKRTVKIPVLCWQTDSQRNKVIEEIPQEFHEFIGSSTRFPERLQERAAAITGTPHTVVEQLREYEAAGVEELIIQILGTGGNTALGILAQEILPHFK